MSHLLELLGRGLPSDLGDLLDRYYWSASARPLPALQETCREQPDSAESRLQLGLALLRDGDAPAAAGHLQHACRLKPDRLAARVALAAALAESGQAPSALESLQIANRIQPGEPPVLFSIGFCLEKLRRPSEAAEYYRDAVARQNDFEAARERLAACCLSMGQTAGAIEQYEVLRKVRPQDAWVRTTLAHLYHQDKQFARSVEEFETAIAMQPENWSLLSEEVEALIAAGHLRDAIDRLHQLLVVQGPFADIHVRLGDLYGQLGDDEAALKHYHEAIELQADYLEANVKLGTHHLVFGRWEQAAEAFAEAVGINDAQMINYVGLGVAQCAAGRSADAVNSFELASAVEPNSTLLMAEIARLQLKCAAAQDMERSFAGTSRDEPPPAEFDGEDLLRHAIHRYAQLVEKNPGHADLRYHYGLLLHTEGRTEEAMEQLAAALRINPSFVQARIKLGVLQMENGQEEQAMQSFRESLDLRPGAVEAHYWLGLLYTERRQLEDAARHMEAAAAGSPGSASVRAGLAMSLQNMGLLDRSAAVWRSVWKSAAPTPPR